jgi:hypothetical protein
VQVVLRCRWVFESKLLVQYLIKTMQEIPIWLRILFFRPLSDEEQRTNVSKVIACNEHKREVTVLHSIANKQVDRVFTFDKVTIIITCHFDPPYPKTTIFFRNF